MRTDQDLMMAYQDGDVAAFETLTRRYWGPVYRFLRRLVGNDAVAEEILSETFFKLHRAAATYQPRGRFSTFLFAIAHHKAIDVLREARRQGTREPLSPTGRDGRSHTITLESPELRPDAKYEFKETMQNVDRILESLPDAHRAAFILYYQEELPTKEIARVLDVKPSSVRAYLTHARTALRAEISNTHEPCATPYGAGR